MHSYSKNILRKKRKYQERKKCANPKFISRLIGASPFTINHSLPTSPADWHATGITERGDAHSQRAGIENVPVACCIFIDRNIRLTIPVVVSRYRRAAGIAERHQGHGHRAGIQDVPIPRSTLKNRQVRLAVPVIVPGDRRAIRIPVFRRRKR